MSQQTTIYKDYQLSIKTRTSKTTQNCMYDHESNHFSTKSLKTSEFGNIVRIKDDIQFSSSTKPSSPETSLKLPKYPEQIVTRLRPSSDGVWIKDTKKRSIEEGGLWVPLGRVGNRSREELKNDDIFRLGKRIYKVLKIQLKDEMTSLSVEDEITTAFQGKPTTDSKCRICLAGFAETNLPVIKPCDCKGTVGNMHAKCFRMWVCSKLDVTKEKNCLSIAWRDLTCELCNGNLASSMKACEEDVALLNFKKVLVAPFMIVKEVSSEDGGVTKNVHVFGLANTDKKPLQMGRSNEVDFQIKDVSVSRVHSELSVINNRVYIQDKGSRFGTLILKGKGIKLNEETLESPWYQIGRTLIRIKLSRPWGKVLPWLKSMITSNKKVVRKVTPEHESRTLESETDCEKTISRSSPDKRSEKTMDVIKEEEDEVDSIEGDDEVREMPEGKTMGFIDQEINSRQELLEEKEKSASSSESSIESGDAQKGAKIMMMPALSYSMLDSKFLSPIPMEKNDSLKGSYIDEIQKIRL